MANFVVGYGTGVDKRSMSEGDGFPDFLVVVAVSVDPNTVHVTTDMDLLPYSVTDPGGFEVFPTAGGDSLKIIRSGLYASNVIELTVEDMEDINYTVNVYGGESVYGSLVGATNSATFLGEKHPAPSIISFTSFFGLEAGMQAEEQDVLGPTLTGIDPLASEPDVPLTSNIECRIADTGSGVSPSTILVYVDTGGGATLVYDNGFKPGWDGPGSGVVTSGGTYPATVDITIDPTSPFPADQVMTVSAYAEDKVGNVIQSPTSYTFTTEAIAALIDAQATNYSTVRLTYVSDMAVSPVGSGKSAKNPNNYSIAGLTITGVTAISNKVFELSVSDMISGATYTVIVAGTVSSLSGTVTIADSLLVDPTADREDFLGMADQPRLVEVTNPAAGVLNVEFSKAMRKDAPLETIETYQVTPIGTAKPLFITGAKQDSSIKSRVVLSYTGGGSVYRMTVTGVHGAGGNPIDTSHNSALFDLLYPTVDELFTGNKVLMDTNLGAIQLTYNTLSKRRIEDLVILRAKSVAHNTQFQLISEALKDAGISRDDTRLNLFKG